jgi:hypothetical protein
VNIQCIQTPAESANWLIDSLNNVTTELTEPGSDDGPNTLATYLLSIASGWAYADPETFAQAVSAAGLPNADCYYVSVVNDAMLLTATAYFVRKDGVGILCFRGTEPANIINWLTDTTVDPVQFNQQVGKVHGGFYRNLQAVWQGIIDAIDDSQTRKGRLRSLYICGHSLGAAMAALAAMQIWFNQFYADLRKQLRAVYTFGQPAVADPDGARLCDETGLSKIVYRFVYDHDIVPQLPPRSTGRFKHFGHAFGSTDHNQTLRWDSEVKPGQQAASALLSVPVALLAYVLRQLPLVSRLSLPFSIDDHSPIHYIECSELDERRINSVAPFRARALKGALKPSAEPAATPGLAAQ